MNVILNKLAIGSYEAALHPPFEITALLNVAAERDVETQLLYHKVLIADMKPIPPNSCKKLWTGLESILTRLQYWSPAMQALAAHLQS